MDNVFIVKNLRISNIKKRLNQYMANSIVFVFLFVIVMVGFVVYAKSSDNVAARNIASVVNVLLFVIVSLLVFDIFVTEKRVIRCFNNKNTHVEKMPSRTKGTAYCKKDIENIGPPFYRLCLENEFKEQGLLNTINEYKDAAGDYKICIYASAKDSDELVLVYVLEFSFD